MIYDYEYFKKEIYSLTTIDLNAYKEKQMKRRIDTLIAKHKIVGYDKYVQALKTDRELFEEFVGYITINVSEFYRNPEQWKYLDETVIPELIQRFGKNLKIWSAACSTGDEPYSLVMALSRHVPLQQIHIYATDLDKQVIAKAKSNNMPNDTIERGIKKAAGDGNSVNYETATYEGYGPSGTAIIVKCLTDNKNRTAANVRNAFTKGQGSIGTQGCVSYMFDEKGQIIIDKEECDMDADDLMMQALDAGAEDFADEDDSYEITTAPADFDAVRTALEEAGITMASAEVTMIPQTYVTLTDEADITNIGRILDLLDDDDDVQEVYHNWEE